MSDDTAPKSARPGLLTAAASVQFFGTFLGIITGFAALMNSGTDASLAPLGSAPKDLRNTIIPIAGIIAPILGFAGLYAGLQIRKLTERGLKVGMNIGYIGIGLGIVELIAGIPVGAAAVLAYGFIVYALTKGKDSFLPPAPT